MPGSEPEVVGFLPLRLDVTLGRLVWFDPQGKQPSVPITNDPETAKPVLLALMLLRELSSNLKVEPIPRVEMGITANGGDVEREFLLVINRESARLYRVAAPPPWGDWFVLRAASNPEEPFTQATTVVDTFKLRSTKPFRDVPIEAISKNLKEQSR